MVIRQITAIALRLLAIWLLIQLILNLSSLIVLFANVEDYQQHEMPLFAYVSLIISFLAVGLVAAYLINKSANSVLDHAESQPETSLSNDSQKVLFQLAGFYFVVDAVSYLPRSLAFIPKTEGLSLLNLLWPAGVALQLIIGLWLVGSSSFWVGVFHKLRGSG